MYLFVQKKMTTLFLKICLNICLVDARTGGGTTEAGVPCDGPGASGIAGTFTAMIRGARTINGFVAGLVGGLTGKSKQTKTPFFVYVF